MLLGMAMTEQAFLVLTALAREPMHGYGIVGEVAGISGDRVKLKVGTLYGVLDRLVAEGLVAPDRDEVHNGRLRHYYRLTDAGRGELAAEAHRQAANAQAAVARLGLVVPGAGLPGAGVRENPAGGTA
jgi:PadR family transcriptional regulator PadR